MMVRLTSRLFIALVLLVATTALNVASAHAQTLSQPFCEATAVTQPDLAGYYASDTMALSVYPCGGSFLEWTNAYGKHTAGYVTVRHLPDGVVAVPMYAGGGGAGTVSYLDSSEAIGYKAAEPGYIDIITVGPLGSRTYRLRKLY